MTIIKRLPTAFTGDQSATPLLLPAAGVGGYANRWFASEQAGAEGAALASLVANTGSVTMGQTTTTKQPTVHIESGQKMVRFDGTDDDMGSGTSVATMKTIAVIARQNNAVGAYKGLFGVGGGSVFRDSGTPGAVELSYTGGTAVKLNQATNDSKFHVIIAVGDGTNNVRAVAADQLYSALGSATGQNELVLLGRTGSTGYGQVDYLEIITWPFALTQAQCLAVYQSAKKNYPLFVA